MILNNVKRLLQLKLSDTSKDEVLSFIIELVLAKVKTFCNISSENEILQDYDFNLLIAQIAADTFNSYQPKTYNSNSESETNPQSNIYSNPNPNAEVKSITTGDYKVEYNVATTSKSFSSGSLSESISFNLNKYDEELVNYRYVKFY